MNIITKATINEFITEFVAIAHKQSKLSRSKRAFVVGQVKAAIQRGWIKVEGNDIWNALLSEEKPEPMNLVVVGAK